MYVDEERPAANCGAKLTFNAKNILADLYSPVKQAHSLARMGWPVIPLHTVKDGVCSCGKAGCPSPGKHPRTLHGSKDATTDPTQIDAWFSAWSDSNVGIATGSASRLAVIDVDAGGKGGYDSFRALEEEIGKLPETLTVFTGGGGKALLFALSQR